MLDQLLNTAHIHLQHATFYVCGTAGEVIEWLEEIEEPLVESNDLLSNLAKSTENLSKIKNKDEWLNEVRGNELHPDTENLLKVCFEELRLKLIKSQEKYGYSNEWLICEWEQECREEMMKHIQKGDPRDVAIYAMFMIYRGWATSVKEKEELIIEVRGKEGLEEKFKTELNSTKHWNSVNDFDVDAAAKQCSQITQQYTNSKLEEIENKIIEDLQFLADKATDPVVKIAYESMSITIVKTHFSYIK